MEESFEANNSKVGVLITGAPGSGKSALVAQLICSRTSSLFIHNNIIGYHICCYSNKGTQNVVKFIRNLFHMIARRVSKYREVVTMNRSLRKILDHLCPLKPSACFRKVILDPLKQIEGQDLTVRYIVIDAMDECMPSDTQTSSDILTLIRENMHSLPRSVKILLTSRPMRRISNLKQFFTIVDIDPADPKNIDDIDSYIARRVYFEYSSFATFSLRFVSGIDDRVTLLHVMSKLVNQSQGNFLFAREAIQFTLTSPTENYGSLFLPQTLGDIYHKYFQRAFPTRDSFTLVRPILELLVAATAPLSTTDMFKMIGKEDKYEYFESKLNELSHFLRFNKIQGTVNLYHKALADWLTSSEIEGELYYVSKEEGCRMLAKYCLNLLIKEHFSVTAEMVLQVSQYISCAGMEEKHIAAFKLLPSGNITNIKTAHGSLLHTAALSNDPNVLKLLIHHFNNVDVKDHKGFTPAFLAILHGMHSNLETLYKAGANINVVSYDCPHDAKRTLEEQYPKVLNKGKLLRRRNCRSTMLRAAVIRSNVQIVRFLLANDVNMNDETETESLASALDVAAEIGNLTIVKLLHNARKLNAGSSLRFATQSNRTAIVKYFLESGVRDKCVRCESIFVYSFPKLSRRAFYREGHIIDCETSLHIAVRKGFTQLVKLFLIHGGKALKCPNKYGLLPIHYSVLANNSGLVQLLLNKGDNIDEPCHSNISKANFVPKEYRLENEDMLFTWEINSANIRPLENDIRVNTTCVCDTTPLHLAARFGFVEILTVLIENGANISGRDCNGSTALHIAACHNQFAVFKKLVEQGVDPNVKSFNGSTPFHSAALCSAKDLFIPIYKLGANAYLRDNNGMTVVHYAALYCESNQPLVLYDDFNVTESVKNLSSEKWLESFVLFALSLDSPDFISAARNDGQTVLHILAKCGHYVGVLEILNMARVKKADIVNIRDNSGNTAVDLALSRVNQLVSEHRLQTGEFIAHSFIPRLALSGDYDLTIRYLLKEMNATGNISYFSQVFAHPLVHSASVFSGNEVIKTKGLLTYLRDRSNIMIHLLPRNDFHSSITCHLPFNQSVFHLLAFRMTEWGLWLCQESPQWSFSGTEFVFVERWKLLHPYFYKSQATENTNCLNSVLTAREKERHFLEHCLDSEGFSCLHRAAQGSNLLAVREFLELGMDVFANTKQGYNALELSILYAVKVNVKWSAVSTFKNIDDAIDIGILDVKLASKVAITLLRQALRKGFFLRCNEGLTVYHYAASRGMIDFIKILFEDLKLSQDDKRCEDKNRITPLYLAHLYQQFFLAGISNWRILAPWEEVIKFVKSSSNFDRYSLNKNAELFLIYSYLYKGFNHPFQPDLTLNIIRGLAANIKRKECKPIFFQNDDCDNEFSKVAETLVTTSSTIVINYLEMKCIIRPCVVEEYITKIQIPLMRCLNFINMVVHRRFWNKRYLFKLQHHSLLRRITKKRPLKLNCFVASLLDTRQLFYKYMYTFVPDQPMLSNVFTFLKVTRIFAKCRYVITYGNYVVSAFAEYVREQEAASGTFVPYITNFIRDRMNWRNQLDDHVWPLPFLVKIMNNDTARYDYLKSLNIGI